MLMQKNFLQITNFRNRVDIERRKGSPSGNR